MGRPSTHSRRIRSQFCDLSERWSFLPPPFTGVAVTDLLPAGLTLVSANPAQGTYAPATGLWSAGTVRTGHPVDLVLRARVTSPSTATNVATVTAADQFDPNPGNNRASASETPRQADLVVNKDV